jgi:hypothetical protein
MMRLVILESPYAGDVIRNTLYARRCLRDSLMRGEAPIMSHLLHTQVLNDHDPEDRRVGIAAGVAWIRVADVMVVYMDHGLSAGMQSAVALAESLGLEIEYRRIGATIV